MTGIYCVDEHTKEGFREKKSSREYRNRGEAVE